jgi:hypothetical protein
MAEFKNITDIWVTKPPFEIDKVYVVIPYEDEDEKILRAYLGEIIRCRDCKNLIKSDDNFGEDEPYYYCDIFNHMINFDDFCSRAERRSEK